MNRWNGRRDQNQNSIVHELEKQGIQCADLSGNGAGCPDLLLYYRGNVVFCELKFGKRAVLKKTQVKFLGNWRGHCGIALDATQALNMAVDPEGHCLTARQKEFLLAYHYSMQSKQVAVSKILKLIREA